MNGNFCIALLLLSILHFSTPAAGAALQEQNIKLLLNSTYGPGVGYTYPQVPPEFALQYTWTATATHYDASQAGTPICPNRAIYCGAPSDGSQFWEGGACNCGSSDPTCAGGKCYDCYGANECQSECPKCPTNICGHNFKITCIDPYGQGYCKYSEAQVTMTVTNACPQYNPCNTCKSPNPCRANYNHIDLCNPTFDAIAIRSKQPAVGIMIGVDYA